MSDPTTISYTDRVTLSGYIWLWLHGHAVAIGALTNIVSAVAAVSASAFAYRAKRAAEQARK